MPTVVQPDTIVLCVQNGLGSETVVKDVMAGRCLVLRAITQFGAIFSEPGVVDLKGGRTHADRGGHSAARRVADLLTASGLDGRVSPAINTEIWRKLIFNCVINPITSIVGSEVGGIADPRLDPLKRLVIDECLRVAATDGVSFQEDFVRAIAETFGASRNIASMRQDLQRGAADRDRLHERRGRRAGATAPHRLPGECGAHGDHQGHGASKASMARRGMRRHLPR